MDSKSTKSHSMENQPIIEKFSIDATIFVGKNESLSLSPESLIIRGTGTEKDPGRKVSRRSVTLDSSAYSEPVGATATRAIPLYNVLWAELSESSLIINYARQISKTTVHPAVLNFSVDEESRVLVGNWVERLLKQAYGKSQPEKRLRVLINPKSGKGGADKLYYKEAAPIFEAAHCHVTVSKTTYQGEAIEIAEKLDIESFDAAVACSGDGLIHEIFNGFGKRPDAKKALAKIALAHIPGGSGNGMSCNLNGNKASASMSALITVKGIRTPLDLISITQGDKRLLSFLSQSLGIVAEFDLATENLRWMGPLRFTYGYLIRAMKKKKYPCDLAVKAVIEDKDEIISHYQREVEKTGTNVTTNGVDGSEATNGHSNNAEDGNGLPALKYGTVNDDLPEDWKLVPSDRLGNFYCGNMGYMAPDVNYFPAALPNDGFMDLVCIDGDISRTTALKLMPAVANGSFFRLPVVDYRKVLGYRITPKFQDEGYISIDGERIPWEPYQAEIHQGLGTVLSKSGRVYEAPGPR